MLLYINGKNIILFYHELKYINSLLAEVFTPSFMPSFFSHPNKYILAPPVMC